MVFSSQIFLFYFLPLCLAGYYLSPPRWRNLFLTAASYVFYGWWHAWFCALMLLSTCIDYGCGKAIAGSGANTARRKAFLGLSVVTNLGLLGFFKYGVFVQENALALSQALGGPSFAIFDIVLPLGISFYTFQSMSYSIDVYRGHAEPSRSLVDFSCYVAMFPQLVAGPIVRYREIAEQLGARPQRGELFARGTLNFAAGFVKKVVLANTMGQVADLAFGAESLPAHVAWFGLLAYMFQVYFDFSGYSDMAIGLGQLFGFQLPINFASPYRSKSITELWARWHISLSSWLRDYLYVPLGGNRKGPLRTYFNLFVTMTLGGFWHGAEWQLIVFGACHGAALALERRLGKRPFYHAWPGPLRNAATMLFFYFTLPFFRAEDMAHAGRYFGAMFGGLGSELGGQIVAGRAYSTFFLCLMAVCALITWAGRETREVVLVCERRAWAGALLLLCFALAVVVLFAQAEDPFIYFRF